MAQILTNVPAAPHGASLRHAIATFFGTFSSAIRANREVQELYALSDRQLAELGLKREEVAQYVYKRSFDA
ncbi:DUF1127 domain-containing protein [Pseudooceanicola sp. HF7]|uniref:DUF1127 domain-containing protein n=1 Tax=Pseudooceanicola sp. HF7 TaxID=2721560 RepID=UPI001430C138|nr:DUF1127 domain-containing protein [Pseudooceanicola sp. HF7]NIZ08486.1 DUF1127 domain-containing protein [Pseudooceanicola sp. HF7]